MDCKTTKRSARKQNNSRSPKYSFWWDAAFIQEIFASIWQNLREEFLLTEALLSLFFATSICHRRSYTLLIRQARQASLILPPPFHGLPDYHPLLFREEPGCWRGLGRQIACAKPDIWKRHQASHERVLKTRMDLLKHTDFEEDRFQTKAEAFPVSSHFYHLRNGRTPGSRSSAKKSEISDSTRNKSRYTLLRFKQWWIYHFDMRTLLRIFASSQLDILLIWELKLQSAAERLLPKSFWGRATTRLGTEWYKCTHLT